MDKKKAPAMGDQFFTSLTLYFYSVYLGETIAVLPSAHSCPKVATPIKGTFFLAYNFECT